MRRPLLAKGLQAFRSVLRLVGIVVLVAGCVPDVGNDPVPPPNPIPPGAEGEGSGDPSSQTQVTATGYLTQIAMIQCEQAFSCRATYPSDGVTFQDTWSTSVAACVAMLQAAWGTNLIESEIAKGRIEFDGTAAIDCLAGVAFGSCDTQWTSGIQWADSCYDVMNGNVTVGGSCDSVYACSSYNCDAVQHQCI